MCVYIRSRIYNRNKDGLNLNEFLTWSSVVYTSSKTPGNFFLFRSVYQFFGRFYKSSLEPRLHGSQVSFLNFEYTLLPACALPVLYYTVHTVVSESHVD